MYIFSTLMGARHSVYRAEVTTAFNLIDVVFHDCRSVREAWADLYAAYNDERLNAPHGHVLRDEKLNALLFQMAQVLEIGSELRFEDINRVYVPESVQKQALIEMHQRDRLFSEIQASTETDKTAIPPLSDPKITRRR